MPVGWTPDLSVGVDVIDDQHKEIFARANSLIEATRRGGGRDEVAALIGFLEQYVVVHFAVEEKYMVTFAYEDFVRHKAEHQGFARDFAALKKQYDAYGPTRALVMETEQRTAHWLRNHIGRVDKALGTFLKARLA